MINLVYLRVHTRELDINEMILSGHGDALSIAQVPGPLLQRECGEVSGPLLAPPPYSSSLSLFSSCSGFSRRGLPCILYNVLLALLFLGLV